MQQVAQIAILVLSVIILVGGIIGFKKANSKASLIAGAISSVVLGICFGITFVSPQAGYISAIGVAVLLEAIFIKRFIKTKKFMPAGMILLCCLGTQGVLLKALF